MDVKDYVKLLHDLKILEIKVANIFEKRLEISLTTSTIIRNRCSSHNKTFENIRRGRIYNKAS